MLLDVYVKTTTDVIRFPAGQGNGGLQSSMERLRITPAAARASQTAKSPPPWMPCLAQVAERSPPCCFQARDWCFVVLVSNIQPFPILPSRMLMLPS